MIKKWTKEEKTAMEWWISLPRKQQIKILAKLILDTNNRVIAEGVMGKELNDIEFQAFKRYLRSEL